MNLGENIHVVAGLAPDADRFNGDPATDVVSLSHHEYALAIVHVGTNGGGAATITVEECDDFTPTNSTAIAFNYRVVEGATSDSWGDWAAATSSGITDIDATFVGMIQIYVRASQLTDGYPNIRLVFTETTDNAIDGACVFVLGNSRYDGESEQTAIA